MNVVKMQDMLKDLSDRQLMQTMEAGSSPQYLVLAEMQRRKKAREGGAQSESQSDRSVADDIISGIAAVPTGPMEMAEGGIVSFAGGGKTGRMKGEEEACYVDSRTGEKYCPPSRPQVEMPRTGQRKSFQEGGMIPPQEMVEMDIARRLQELQSRNPNATEYDAIQALMREGTYGLRLSGSSGTDASDTTTSPAMPSPQPEPAPAPSSGLGELSGGSGPMGMGPGGPMGVGGSSTYAPGQPGEVTMPETESQRGVGADGGFSFGDVEEGLTNFLRRIAPGTNGDGEFGGTGEMAPAAGGSPTAESGVGLPFITYKGEPLIEPIESVEEERRRRRQEEAAPSEQPAEQPTDKGVDDNQFSSVSDTDDDKDPERDPEPQTEDGLMQLMRELQAERQESRETAQERALNQALIRGGLAMAASDDPDFLSAAAEGGIGGLAGYQSAMERAAERQGEISSDLTDLAVARETAALKQRAAQAAMEEQMTDKQYENLELLQGEIENVNQQLTENMAMPEEDRAKLKTYRDRLMAAYQRGMAERGVEVPSGSDSEGPESEDTVTIDGN